MDIQVASNFERYLFDRAAGDGRQVVAWMETFKRTGRLDVPVATGAEAVICAGRGDTAATLTTIRDFWKQQHYLLDPHTAVGVHVGLQQLDPAAPMICLATAHPAKFGDAILKATGEDLAHHPLVDALANRPTRVTRLSADRRVIADYVSRAITAAPHTSR